MPSRQLIFCLLLGAASAHGHAQDKRLPPPMNPAAPAPQLAYDSAFAGYRADDEPKVESWKETNARLGQQSGHAGHAGHDMGKMKPPAKPAEKAEPAKPDPHAEHKH